ncbi:MAG: flavodoxin family protein [Alphaproteobacteria bacterium]
MKVVAFNGSPRKGGNTSLLIQEVFKSLEKEGVETELVELANKEIKGCTACYKCKEMQNKRCAYTKDYVNTCLEKMEGADAIILGSPTYFTDVTTEMKALIDRTGMVAKANNNMFKRKLGAAVVAVRRAGSIHAFDTMNHYFQIGEMIIIGSSYWNNGFGKAPGDVLEDEEGLKTMRTLGENMAWLLKKMKG